MHADLDGGHDGVGTTIDNADGAVRVIRDIDPVAGEIHDHGIGLRADGDGCSKLKAGTIVDKDRNGVAALIGDI